MTIYRITQGIEIKFWNLVILLMEDEGPLMKTIRSINQTTGKSVVNILLLILVWAAIGFISGMIIGRFILMFQLL
jgi:hypothetical protein